MKTVQAIAHKNRSIYLVVDNKRWGAWSDRRGGAGRGAGAAAAARARRGNEGRGRDCIVFKKEEDVN